MGIKMEGWRKRKGMKGDVIGLYKVMYRSYRL